jgi:heptosyltransferase-2
VVTTSVDRPPQLPKKILVIQTAFLGDVILALPLIQALKESVPGSRISPVVLPATAEVLHNHPAVDHYLVFDKRGQDKGFRRLLGMARQLRRERFDLALIPHRSLRSALLAFLAGIPRRVGFDTSAGSFLLTETVHYDRKLHEVQRNVSLLCALGFEAPAGSPRVYPGEEHRRTAQAFLAQHGISGRDDIIGLAPGSFWPTKRWLPQGYASVIRQWRQDGDRSVVLLGGAQDRRLCLEIARLVGEDIPVAAGELSVLSATALMENCRLIVSNDSAAAHLAAAAGRPVVVLFGPTVPEFGFAPYGQGHIILQADVDCRPCGIHGGKRCPRKTFACMRAITPEKVFGAVRSVLDRDEEGELG